MEQSLDHLLEAGLRESSQDQDTYSPLLASSSAHSQSPDVGIPTEEDGEYNPRRKGKKPVDDEPDSRRVRNRAAQRTFRVRKDQHLKELEAQVEEMTGLYSESFNLVERLHNENSELRSDSGIQAGPSLNDRLHGNLEPLYQAHLANKDLGLPLPPPPASASEESPQESPASGSLSTSSAPVPGPSKKKRTSKYDLDRIPNFAGAPARASSIDTAQTRSGQPSNRSSSNSTTQPSPLSTPLEPADTSQVENHISPLPMNAQTITSLTDESVSGAPPFETRAVE